MKPPDNEGRSPARRGASASADGSPTPELRADRGETPPPRAGPETTRPAEDDPSKPADEEAATGEVRDRRAAVETTAAAVADRVGSAGEWLWRRARRLAVHGTAATRPLETALRATGLVVVGFAPLWPLFGSPPNGWWDWLLTTLANVGIGLVLFGAGETVRKINEVHASVVARRDRGEREEKETRT